jgi:hypothetical protein
MRPASDSLKIYVLGECNRDVVAMCAINEPGAGDLRRLSKIALMTAARRAINQSCLDCKVAHAGAAGNDGALRKSPRRHADGAVKH